MDAQTIIARRVAQELRPGNLVNLGIGIPTLVANYVPEGLKVFFQSENGLIGTGPIPEQGMAHPLLTDAGGKPISALPGAATFDSAMSFGLIRGGHVDVTVLGGLQVDAGGRLANWMIPGKMVPGMGGAMDPCRPGARQSGDARRQDDRAWPVVAEPDADVHALGDGPEGTEEHAELRCGPHPLPVAGAGRFETARPRQHRGSRGCAAQWL